MSSVGYSPEVATVFDRLWGSYSEWTANSLRLILGDEFGLKEGRILDVGCGTGRLICLFSKWNWTAVGIDLSEAMVSEANKTATVLQSPSARFQVGSMTNFGVPGEFDVVTSVYDTLNHAQGVAEVQLFLNESALRLAPGGVVVVDFNTALGLEDWNRIKIVDRKDILLVSRGVYDSSRGVAYKRFNGFMNNNGVWVRFEDNIHNIAISCHEFSQAAKQAGLNVIRYCVPKDLKECCGEPEAEDRVFAFLQHIK